MKYEIDFLPMNNVYFEVSFCMKWMMSVSRIQILFFKREYVSKARTMTKIWCFKTPSQLYVCEFFLR